MNIWCHLILISYIVTAVAGSCTVHTYGRLRFLRRFFSKDVIIKPPSLTLEEGESTVGYCNGEISFEKRGYGSTFTAYKSISIKCHGGSIYMERPDHQKQYNYDEQLNTLTCEDSTEFSLYENSKPMPGCDNYWSFGYGMNVTKSFTKAAICYDLPNIRLKSINYISPFATNMDLIDPSQSLATAQLGNEAGDLEQLSPSTGKYEDKLLLLAEHFSFHSLILDLKEDSSKLIFQIPFWFRLYNGNWKLFREAFDEHVKQLNVKYDVYSGVSGQLEAPQQNCYTKKIYDDVPRYIWTYLRPVNTATALSLAEVVVIADNSPYINHGPSELLCKDICKDIDWLHNYEFGRYHLMNSNGLIYCCNPEEVHLKLDFFPSLLMNDSQEFSETDVASQRPES